MRMGRSKLFPAPPSAAAESRPTSLSATTHTWPLGSKHRGFHIGSTLARSDHDWPSPSARKRIPAATNRPLNLAIKPPRDPGFAALRRAARAAIVIPLAFAFTDLVMRQAQVLIFVVFGCFSLLVISDFGGLRRPRALAYLTATLAGAVLVALGTLVSSSLWLAALVMLVVGFAISFSRIFGGYVAAASIGLILSFVIAVTIPAPPDVIPARVGGWVLAGLVSTLAAVALWPRFERVTMHGGAAKALHAVADLVEGMQSAAGDRDLPRLKEAARKAVDDARRTYATTAKRPDVPARRGRAFAELLLDLDRIVQTIERPFHQDRPVVRPGLAASDRLAASVLSALRVSADTLMGGRPPDVHAIDVARNEHRAALDRSPA